MNCWSSPYQNLIHSLDSDAVLEVFKSIFDESFKGFSVKEEFHVSLLYGRTNCQKLEAEMENLKNRLPLQVSFSEARIIELDKKVQDWKTIQSIKI